MVKRTGSLSVALGKYATGKASVRVGVLESAKYPDGVPVAQALFWNEYGAQVEVPESTTTVYRSINEKTGDFNKNGKFVKRSKSNFATQHTVPAHIITIPPRPVMRAVVSDNKDNWIKSIGELIKIHGDAKKSLLLLGEHVKGQFVESVLNWSDPPNAASTVAKKGFNAPLRNTAQLSRSFSVELEE